MTELLFDAKTHTYTAGGRRVPGVTSVIAPLEPFDSIPLPIKQQALERGTMVHELTSRMDADTLDFGLWEAIEESNLDGYLIAWEAFKRDVVQEILENEQKVFSKMYWYAGTIDRVAKIKDRLSIIEIKTGGLVDAYCLQTAAYKQAKNEEILAVGGMSNDLIQDRYVVVLQPDGLYKMVRHDDPTDFQTFIAALTIANWRATHK